MELVKPSFDGGKIHDLEAALQWLLEPARQNPGPTETQAFLLPMMRGWTNIEVLASILWRNDRLGIFARGAPWETGPTHGDHMDRNENDLDQVLGSGHRVLYKSPDPETVYACLFYPLDNFTAVFAHSFGMSEWHLIGVFWGSNTLISLTGEDKWVNFEAIKEKLLGDKSLPSQNTRNTSAADQPSQDGSDDEYWAQYDNARSDDEEQQPESSSRPRNQTGATPKSSKNTTLYLQSFTNKQVLALWELYAPTFSEQDFVASVRGAIGEKTIAENSKVGETLLKYTKSTLENVSVLAAQLGLTSQEIIDQIKLALLHIHPNALD